MSLLGLMQTETEQIILMKVLSTLTLEQLKKTVRKQARDIIKLGQEVKAAESGDPN